MIRSRAAAIAWIGLATLTASGCAGARRAASSEATAGTSGFAVYRARIEVEQEGRRSFRLLLWAASPGRLHAEVISPVGSTELVVDGGGGMLAVSRPKQRVAWVGPGDGVSIERLVGVRASLDELVGAILDGAPLPGARGVERSPEQGHGLPRRLVLRGERGYLELALRRREPVRGDTASLGTGTAPPGFAIEAIERLPDAFRELAGGEAAP